MMMSNRNLPPADLKPKRFCIKANPDQDGNIVKEGSEFYVSFTVSGAKRPVFRINKGPYLINTTLAGRFMKFEAIKDGNNYNAILRILYSNVWDSGTFGCKVIDGRKKEKSFSLKKIISFFSFFFFLPSNRFTI